MNEMNQYLELAIIVIYYGSIIGLVVWLFMDILRSGVLWKENRSLRKRIKELEAGMDPELVAFLRRTQTQSPRMNAEHATWWKRYKQQGDSDA